MRILIDECIDERMRNLLPGHDAVTARYAGLAGLKNGALLSAAEAAKFDVVLTVDRGFEFEQTMRGRRIAIVIFRAQSNRLSDLLPLISTCLTRLKSLQPGQIARIPD
jgi:predicted nuclease of predicted toxin-antitoxin system